ncbi:ThiF family adenylyltransferase [Spongiactinospora rosea]|uniref:ThiF family adenylyltransferase n=1 Tax=Spongiactinospora rosea TaxID=2248750 RepID=A0A366M327_9ACTN|nr:ThiF family adenylyltransferase [Spongiactinospora rosea]RBQ20601.1 ThiF family adenylyltransferase [Spongiactinospora rosea]
MSKRILSHWQRQVLADLGAIANAFPGDVEMIGKFRLDRSQSMRFRLRLRTADMPRVFGGLPLGEQEEFVVTVGASDLTPPRIEVDHLRFLHHAHVLQGHRLCLYLDPSREWDPIGGFGSFIDRLVDWLGEAASGRFDAQTALYHAVGGVLHATPGAPTVVVRSPLPSGKRAHHGWLVARTPHRFDLLLDRRPVLERADHVPIVVLDADLPFGAGTNFRTFLRTVDAPYHGKLTPGVHLRGRIDTGLSATVLTVLGASAIRKADGTAQRLIIAVPHPTGDSPHLIAASIPASGADHLRGLIRSNRKSSSMICVDPAEIDPTTSLEWWQVSDERREVTIRRDSARPVTAYTGKTVHVWGCGGLGSWIAEYVVRAGAKRVILCDPGVISGGLLVRQNFVEADVGSTKVEALARRLRAISDTVEVTASDAMMPGEGDLAEVDLIIDATVSIAISRVLDGLAAALEQRPVLAQVATDARTGTLGAMTVSMPPLRVGPLTIDREAGKQIAKDGTYEAFHALWRPSTSGDEIIPTRGCSTPTFHGSAADMAGVAGSLTSILGAHLGAGTAVSGTHLISLPHGEAGPLRTFVPALSPPAGPLPADETM